MSELDQAAKDYRAAKENLKLAEVWFEEAKTNFICEFEDEFGVEEPGTFTASDGYTYGRVAKTVGGGFDFESFMREHPGYAKLVSKRVLDPDALQEFVESREELRPMVAQYAYPGRIQLALAPIKKAKEEAV